MDAKHFFFYIYFLTISCASFTMETKIEELYPKRRVSTKRRYNNTKYGLPQSSKIFNQIQRRINHHRSAQNSPYNHIRFHRRQPAIHCSDFWLYGVALATPAILISLVYL